ncbi:MAG TPA: tetratricopeptide repeat protein [Phycisphaerae bacterium]|nr:tetratricopeptide repeat protein [Phycisphaerae bacterium]
MARRKKLNKRVAVLLGAMGAVVVALVLVLVLQKGGSLLDRLFPRDPVELLKQAKAAQTAKKYEAAAKLYDEAIRAARVTGAANMHEYFHEAARLSRDWALSSDSGLTKTQRGELFRAAVSQLRLALNRKPDYVEAQKYLAEMYWEIAAVSQGKGWPEYVREADALLKLAPDDHQTWFRRGMAKASMSQSMEGQTAKDAIEDVRKALSLKGDETGYWIALVSFLRRLETRDAEVEQAYQQAIEAVPSDDRLLEDYAGYLREADRNDQARQMLDRAIELNPIRGHLALGDHLVALGKLDEALTILKHVTAIDPLDPRAYLRQAHVFAQQAKSAQAVGVLREGLEVIDRVAATQPADGRRVHQRSTAELNYLLANVLLDMVEDLPFAQDKQAERNQLLDEARECLRKMAVAKLRAALRGKVSGRIALAEGKIGEAAEQLEEAYRALPRFDVKTANLLINIYLRQDLPGKAEAILNDLLRIPGQQRNPSALLAKARLLMRYRDYDQADRYLTRVLQIAPKNADAMNLKMVILAVLGETPSLPSEMEPSARTIRMLLDRASALWLDGSTEEAVTYVERLRERVPEDPSVLRMLFSMYRGVGRADDARTLLDEAVKLHPQDRVFALQRQVLDEPDRDKQYEILMKAADEFPPARRALEKANLALLTGKKEDHVKYLREAIEVDPNDAAVVDRLFRYSLQQQDWPVAEQCVERAAKANLDGTGGLLFRTRMALVRKDYDGAITSSLEVLKDQPNRKDARVLLGQAYLSKKFYDPAYEAFKIVANNDPAYAPALIGLAAVTQAQGKLDEHKDWVTRAYRIAPRDPYIGPRYLEIQEETAKTDDLIRQREAVYSRDPSDLRNILRLAMLYERGERAQDAERMYLALHAKSPEKLYSARVLADFYRRSGRPADVERVLDPLLATAEDRVAIRILYGQMIAQFEADKAKGFLENAIATDPDDPRGHLALSRYWSMRRDWRKAVESMRNYVRRRPEDIGGIKELVRYQIEAGEFQPAEDRLNEVLRNDPTDSTATTLKGVLALRQGQVKRAEKLFGQAIQDSPSYAEPLIYRAQLYLAQGEPNKAKADLQAAKRLSERTDVAMQLAAIYAALRDYDNAELVLREVHADQRNYVPAIDRLISIYSRREKWREMEELLAEAKKLFPDSAGFSMREAGMWQTRGRQDLKIAALARAVELAPEAPQTVEAYLHALQEDKQHEKVLIYSEEYLKKPLFTSWVSAVRATSMAQLGRKDLADKAFLQSLETIQPDFVLLLVRQLRDAYGLAGTVTNFEKWLSQRSRNWRLHLVLGLLYSEEGELTKAAGSLASARDLADNAVAKFLAHRHLGATLYQLKKYPEAEQSYLAALKLNGNDVQVLNNLAFLYTDQMNDPAKALPYIDRAAQIWPSNARVLDTLGWTYAQMGRYSDAEVALVRAVQLEQPLTASRYHLGWLYEKIGRLEDALKQYRQGYEMIRASPNDPLYGPLKDALERVQQRLEQRDRAPKTGSGK